MFDRETIIEESYIDDINQRIDIYHKIAAIRDKTDASDVLDELIDRFGEPPAAVKGLVDVALLRNTAAQFGFKEITQKGQMLHLIPEKLDVNVAAMLNMGLKGRCIVVSGQTPYIGVKLQGSAMDTLREIMKVLQSFKSGEMAEKLGIKNA